MDWVSTYNNQMKHCATGLTLKEARNKENEMKIDIKLGMNAKRNRVDIDEGGVYRLRHLFATRWLSNWLTTSRPHREVRRPEHNTVH